MKNLYDFVIYCKGIINISEDDKIVYANGFVL